MKKSKVLIPAMALLLFSTAASISGTVAWFTSTRAFTSDAGKFAVKALDGNLACTVTRGIGTYIDESNSANITLTGKTNPSDELSKTSILGDASFDHTIGNLYTDIPNSTNFRLLGAWALTGNAWDHNTTGTTQTFYGVSWQYTFTYTFVSEATSMNLYFDVNNSTPHYYDEAGEHMDTGSTNTAKGFRMAFVSSSNSKKVVWAPYQTQAAITGTDPDVGKQTIRYVSGPNSDTGAYSTELIHAGSTASNYNLDTAADAKAASMYNCLGTFDKPGSPGDVTITVNMTAWYEGTDPSIRTTGDTVFQQVSASLAFAVRPAAA